MNSEKDFSILALKIAGYLIAGYVLGFIVLVTFGVVASLFLGILLGMMFGYRRGVVFSLILGMLIIFQEQSAWGPIPAPARFVAIAITAGAVIGSILVERYAWERKALQIIRISAVAGMVITSAPAIAFLEKPYQEEVTIKGEFISSKGCSGIVDGVFVGYFLNNCEEQGQYVGKMVEIRGYLYENDGYCPSGVQCPRGTSIELTSIRILDEAQ